MKFKHLTILLSVIAIVLGCNSKQEEKIEYASEAYVGVNIINGTGGDSQNNMTILVKDGEIISIGESGVIQVPADSKIIDCKGKWVMPGLIDMHAGLAPYKSDNLLDGLRIVELK